MSRASTLIVLGVLIVLVPFSGLPVALRSLLAVVFGACVLGIGFALRSREVEMRKASSPENAYVPEQKDEASQNEPLGVSPI